VEPGALGGRRPHDGEPVRAHELYLGTYAVGMATAGIYARISQDRTGNEEGIGRQLEDCRKLAKARGFESVMEYVDNDTSAMGRKKRPQYEQLLAGIKAGEVQAVVVWHVDRLYRRNVELEGYINACGGDNGIPTYSVNAGELDLSTATGRMIARIMGAVAQQESKHKGERISRKRRQAAEQGVWQGGPEPFGWDIDRRTDENGKTYNVPIVNEMEAAFVQYAHRAVLRGNSLTSIVRHFNDQGMPTPRGSRWRTSTLRSMLARSRNCGIESIKGEELGPSTFPALVTEDKWRGVMAKLNNPARKTYRDNSVKHLLSGIARCHCGSPVFARTANGGKLDYPCRELGGGPHGHGNRDRVSSHVSRRAVPLHVYVNGLVPGIMASSLSAVSVAVSQAQSANEELTDEHAALQARAAELADILAEGVMTRQQFERANTSVTKKLDELDTKLAELGQAGEYDSATAEEAATAWEGMSLERKREVLRHSFNPFRCCGPASR
jgi:site-specific DNA recombinase